jgi:hypothetical protein
MPRCLVKGCQEDNKIICEKHMSEPPNHPFEIVKNVTIKSTKFSKSQKIELRISDVILSTSPSEIKTGFKNRGTIKKIKLKLDCSKIHNESNLIVVPVSKASCQN